MSNNVQSPLYFLARSPDLIFAFPASFPTPYPCLLTCELTAVHPSCTALLTLVLSINIIQITAIVLGCSIPVSVSFRFQTAHQLTHIQWRPQPQTNKARFNTGSINLYFNIFKSVYWQTISYIPVRQRFWVENPKSLENPTSSLYFLKRLVCITRN